MDIFHLEFYLQLDFWPKNHLSTKQFLRFVLLFIYIVLHNIYATLSSVRIREHPSTFTIPRVNSTPLVVASMFAVTYSTLSPPLYGRNIADIRRETLYNQSINQHTLLFRPVGKGAMVGFLPLREFPYLYVPSRSRYFCFLSSLGPSCFGQGSSSNCRCRRCLNMFILWTLWTFSNCMYILS